MVPFRFTAAEKKNLASCCTFSLNWNWGETTISDKVVKSWEIIYDGISTFIDEDGVRNGLYFKGNKLEGAPGPVIRFLLTKKVNVEDFTRMVWTSSVLVQSAYQKSKDSTGRLFVDGNGYTHAFTPAEARAVIKFFKAQPFYKKRVYVPAKQKSKAGGELESAVSLA